MVSTKKFKALVADTTAFINNVQLNDLAEKIFTVPDVVKEVKNKRQLRRLVVLPFDLDVKEPSTESLNFVMNFAKKTGDYASLSGIDLKVIALTYDLEKEYVGDNHLRKEPITPCVIASKDKPKEFLISDNIAGFYSDGIKKETDHINDDLVKIEENFADLDLNETEMDKILGKEDLNPSTHGEISNSEESDDDDDSGWITPGNIDTIKKEIISEGQEDDDVISSVACMSTDYAIQNVLKQINLNIASLNGRIIKQMRTYILRCYACFRTTSIITKIFCPSCGNKTLKRVAVSLDENGQQIIHINTKRPLTRKFKNQSIPLARGGKHSRNVIIVEDQPIPKQMPSRIAKTKTNPLDDDYIAGYSPFVRKDVDSKSALLRCKGNIKQWARNNVYEENRRKKYFNRTVK